MSSVKRAHSKLLKCGFLPTVQTSDFECWIDAKSKGNHISFFKNGNSTDVFKVCGHLPDRPEFDEFNSYYTSNLSEAIRVSRFN